jgi:predicted kinase
MKLRELKENMEQPVIIIMVGLPGVGKSTYIRKYFSGYTLISSDDIIEKYGAQEGKTYDEAFSKYIGRASREIKENAQRALKNNENIVWDQTNLTKKKRRGILNRVPPHYKKVAIVFDISDKLRDERMSGREGKTIPPHIVKSMENSYQAPTKDEGFDEILVVKE